LRYALFVSFFPQLVAGPIERSKNLLTQLREKHTFSAVRARDGLLLMLWGYFQKMVIADRVAILVNTVYGNTAAYAGLPLVVAMLFFAVQIYCDFAGYSNIAIGAAQVMGFRLMENFRQPYFAVSIADFWRRWHISLSTWFRDYLYIPLGGNRKGRVRQYLNLMLVFLSSGLWHGASWNFVAWGVLHGAMQVVGGVTKRARARCTKALHIRTDCFSWRLLQMGLTFGLVTIAWVFFRAGGVRAAFEVLRNAAVWNPWTLLDGTLYTLGLSRMEFNIALWAMAALILVDALHERGVHLRVWLAKQNTYFTWGAAIFALAIILTFGVYGINYDAAAFIYFQF
ncbi:MAG: MBOAT family O-acyltransferase, partial [Ruthenibacterium sp.]